jgi:acetyl-CoA carboxylase biotin carboxylase subunit
MEMNTRVQVEHPVTEAITGIDIVKEQIRIAAGERLHYLQDDIARRATAIECRVSAENVARNFMPSPGTITGLQLPYGPGLRIDEGIYEGYKVPYYYDPLLMKLMTWGQTREEAISRMRRSLGEVRIEGIHTTVPFHQQTMEDSVFKSGRYTTDFVEKRHILRKVQEQVAPVKE